MKYYESIQEMNEQVQEMNEQVQEMKKQKQKIMKQKQKIMKQKQKMKILVYQFERDFHYSEQLEFIDFENYQIK